VSETFFINPSDPTPLYAQLGRAIRFAIATGKLRIGEQLPTVRQLAVELRVNANTVAKVYAELERSGAVQTRRGVGTFVCARRFDERDNRDREDHLREFADRLVAETEALGFSVKELIEHLQSRRKWR
jgi:GntR family transcriptional regulator